MPRRILIVDDDARIRESLSRVLSSDRHTTVTVDATWTGRG